jgi:hypothetical protein
MVERDLSSYFAQELSVHYTRRMGGGRVRKGCFEYDSERSPNEIHLMGNFYLNFVDGGRFVRLAVDNPTMPDMGGVASRISGHKFEVAPKYRDVLAGVRAVEGQPGVVEVEVKNYDSPRRERRRKRLFNAIYKTAVAPVIMAVSEELHPKTI